MPYGPLILLLAMTALDAAAERVATAAPAAASAGHSSGLASPKARCEAVKAGSEDAQAVLAACSEALSFNRGDPRLLYWKGRALFTLHRDAEALEAYTAAAEKGWAPAIHQLGVMHHWGYGVPEDPAKGATLYRRALEAGDMSAAIPLARLLREGGGVAKDPAASAALYRRAAEAGLSDGDFGLAYAYETGAGVQPDLATAIKFYRKAAAKGNADAQHNLGVLAEHGRGMAANLGEAVRWYGLAARGGSADAQYKLGVLAEHGRGMPQNFDEALRWYKLSAEAGSTDGMVGMGLAYAHGRAVAKDTAEAERWYRKAIEAGDTTNAPNKLAYLYASENRNLDEAARLAEGALKAGAGQAATMYTLAAVRIRQKRVAEALDLLQQSAALDPTAYHQVRLGDLYAAMGMQEEARKAWQRALAALAREPRDARVTAEDLRRKLASSMPSSPDQEKKQQ